MKLSIIIVNYNVKYFLEQALLSVRNAIRHIDAEIFVVDNNSVDDSCRMVAQKFPSVKLIQNKSNPGFSIANNQAIQQSKGEYVLLLNPDTVVEEDTFEKCITFMNTHLDVGGLGVKMIDGSGRFLPESKRGFPSPFVAFCKTFGLSRLFPKSRIFGRYHLGFLDKNQTQEVDVLAGAFMMLRKSVLDEIGLLDESFFMYGEDIDLSYRIAKAGYKNYYFADTTIIHYKGESTKKGSLNYVKVFYNAMIIFARKHFVGEKAKLFILMLHAAIYFRAFITLTGSFTKRIYLPLIDALLILVGLFILKDFWATIYYDEPDYYQSAYLWFNFTLYITIWLSAIYFNGGYDEKYNIRRLVRGVLMGSLLLAAVYGFLNLQYRPSRALIIMGAVWTLFSTICARMFLHFFQFKNFNLGKKEQANLVIVGSEKESDRVMNLLVQARVDTNLIGTVSPQGIEDSKKYLSSLEQLDEVVHIYKINEIIFCSKNIPAQNIMQWMTRLGTNLDYKIVPEESLSIIGSSSKNTAGELYTIDIRFRIADYMSRRNKRMLDFILSVIFILLFLPFFIIVKNKVGFAGNIYQVLFGKKSWVGYILTNSCSNKKKVVENLPNIKPGVLSPWDALKLDQLNDHTIDRLNFLYAKDYEVSNDFEIIWKGIRSLGNSI